MVFHYAAVATAVIALLKVIEKDYWMGRGSDRQVLPIRKIILPSPRQSKMLREVLKVRYLLLNRKRCGHIGIRVHGSLSLPKS